MYVWSFPKAAQSPCLWQWTYCRFWNNRVSSVNHVTKPNINELFRCCSNFRKKYTSHSAIPYQALNTNFTGISYQWGYLRLNIWSVVGAQGDMSNWLSYVARKFSKQGSARLGTGDGHTNEIAHVSWRLQVWDVWIHPGIQLAGVDE